MNGKRVKDELRLLYGDRCAYCQRHVGARGTVDHYMPLALGGPDEIENMRLCCKPCNGAKADKHPDEWKRRPTPAPATRRSRYEERVRLLQLCARRQPARRG